MIEIYGMFIVILCHCNKKGEFFFCDLTRRIKYDNILSH